VRTTYTENLTSSGAVELLGHTQVTIKPVIDLTAQVPVDAYEVPDAMREVIHLLRPASVYPYSCNLSRHKDLDHPTPYVPMNRGGPPGQTDPYRIGPLGRHEHRVKTHARGWRHLNPLPGVYLWRTRHGYWYRVDRHGTHPLGKNPDLRAHGVHVHEHHLDDYLADVAEHTTTSSPVETAFARLLQAQGVLN
jgi:hypothetical protein